jgi:hypothetical protein
VNLPGEQGAQFSAPTLEDLPGAQPRQMDAPVELAKRPAVHCAHSLFFFVSANVPTAQKMHAVEPSAFWNLPKSQGAHSDDSGLAL